MLDSLDEARCRCACEVIARKIVGPRLSMGISPKKEFRSGHLTTEADLEIEIEIRNYLRENFPECGFVGEELPPQKPDNTYVWVVDPIDGTEAFVAGVPLYGTLLTLIHQGRDGVRRPEFGAIYVPIGDHLIVGNRTVTTVNDEIVKFGHSDFGEARIILGGLKEAASNIPRKAWDALLSLVASCESCQTWGDCLGFLSMIRGVASLRIEFGLGLEDVAVLEPVVLGAGGFVSDARGQTLTSVMTSLVSLADKSADFTSVIASSEALHVKAITVLGIRESEKENFSDGVKCG